MNSIPSSNAAPHSSESAGPALEGARRVAVEIAGKAIQHETEGRLSSEAIAALKSANLFGVLTPTEVGGLETTPTEALTVFEEVSRGEGSTGWVLTTCALANGLAGAYLTDAAVQSIFGQGMPIIAGAGAPAGRAKPVEGGYLFSGRWGYGSGVRHATHLHNGGLIVDGDGNIRADLGHHIFVAPIKAGKLDDQWDVIGLRGTGSVDYQIDNEFLPLGFEHPSKNPKIRRGGNLYRIGMAGMVSLAHTGFFLGIGRRVLDELATVAHSKGGRLGSLLESQVFQEGYGSAEGVYRAARAFVYESWHNIEQHVAKHGDNDPSLLTLAQLSMCHMARASTEAAEFAYKIAGGASLRNGPLQRAFRDCLAGRQHIRVSNAVIATCATELLSYDRH